MLVSLGLSCSAIVFFKIPKCFKVIHVQIRSIRVLTTNCFLSAVQFLEVSPLTQKNNGFFPNNMSPFFFWNPVRLSRHCPGVICSQVLVFFSKPNSFQMSPYLLGFDFGGTLRFVDGSRSFPKIVFWSPAGKCDVVRPIAIASKVTFTHCFVSSGSVLLTFLSFPS